MDSGDWSDQDRSVGGVAYAGEAMAGAMVAIGLQAMLSVTLVGGGAFYGVGTQPDKIAGMLGCAACGQFVWLLPAFLISMWWRPGFAGGLAAGAFMGAFLGFCLACLAAFP